LLCYGVTECGQFRWSSAAVMLNRYLVTKEFLTDLKKEIEDLDELIPNSKKNKQICMLCDQLNDLDSVTKELQKDAVTSADVRALFDGVIESYPSTANRLGPRPKIVHAPDFESAIVKMQEGNFKSSNQNEKLTDAILTTSDDVQVVDASKNLIGSSLLSAIVRRIHRALIPATTPVASEDRQVYKEDRIIFPAVSKNKYM